MNVWMSSRSVDVPYGEHVMQQQLEEALVIAIRQAIAAGELPLTHIPDVALERPNDETNGDWASTVALRCAKEAHLAPRRIAALIVSHMPAEAIIESVDIAGPGFINFHLTPAAWQQVVRQAHEQGTAFGRSCVDPARPAYRPRVLLEYVSANPTGPMHVGHGRWAALGSSLARVMEHAGWEVSQEFYINDAGVQMDRFAQSISVRYLQLCGQDVALPEDAYGGAYITDIAQTIQDAEGTVWADRDADERQAYFKEFGYRAMLAHIKEVLERSNTCFDSWFSERTLYVPDAQGITPVEHALAVLDAGGYLFTEDDARWFRTTDFGDDKDRVLVKSDGSYTYFAPDIAYHYDKFARGYDRAINILGADHHGYVMRLDAACTALGHPGQLEVLLGQLVNLYRDGEAVRMSKRTGALVTFEELLEEVGTDATRYLMLSRSTDQPVDFDIEVAKKQDASNPVYYVQYAHARICSILCKADRAISSDADLSLLTDPTEIALARRFSEFGELIAAAARDRAPFRLTHYAESLASTFHSFYTCCQVITDDEDLTAARLYLADATRQVLALVLDLLGVSAPEHM
jgi:arginyl-tRNA synthetase